MNIPNQLSLEALLAEDGQCVSAGLPPGLDAADEQLRTSEALVQGSEERRERLNQIMARIAEEEAKLKELHKELEQAVRECLQPAPVRPRGFPIVTSPVPALPTTTDRR
jgi:hypothetical protein